MEYRVSSSFVLLFCFSAFLLFCFSAFLLVLGAGACFIVKKRGRDESACVVFGESYDIQIANSIVASGTVRHSRNPRGSDIIPPSHHYYFDGGARNLGEEQAMERSRSSSSTIYC
jgi:hypothetical protein